MQKGKKDLFPKLFHFNNKRILFYNILKMDKLINDLHYYIFPMYKRLILVL